jgi:transcription antitermination factor NusG
MTSRLLHKIWFTRGVESVVSFGGTAAPVDDEIIDLIRAKLRDGGFVRIEKEFKAGDEVVIQSGPFKDLKGVLEREEKETERVRILLTTINYQSHIVELRLSVGWFKSRVSGELDPQFTTDE